LSLLSLLWWFITSIRYGMLGHPASEWAVGWLFLAMVRCAITCGTLGQLVGFLKGLAANLREFQCDKQIVLVEVSTTLIFLQHAALISWSRASFSCVNLLVVGPQQPFLSTTNQFICAPTHISTTRHGLKHIESTCKWQLHCKTLEHVWTNFQRKPHYHDHHEIPEKFCLLL